MSDRMQRLAIATLRSPKNAIEKRVYGLVRPFVSASYEESHDWVDGYHDIEAHLERKAILLSRIHPSLPHMISTNDRTENIAFIIHEHKANINNDVSAEDISLVTSGWDLGSPISALDPQQWIAVAVRYPYETAIVLKSNHSGEYVFNDLCYSVNQFIAAYVDKIEKAKHADTEMN